MLMSIQQVERAIVLLVYLAAVSRYFAELCCCLAPVGLS